MSRKRLGARTLCALALCCLIHIAGAKETTKFGWSPAGGMLSVDDPDGPTGTQSSADPLAAAAAMPFGRDGRLLFGVGQIEFALDGSVTDIGQDVESIYFSGYYQRRLRLARGFKPWVGGGPVVGFNEMTQRFRVDADGFLADELPDREQTSVGLGFSLGHEWEVRPKWDIGFNAEYIFSLDDSIEGVRALLTVFYK